MPPFLALLLLLAATAALCMLPLLPALIESTRKRDAAPLDIIRDHDGNIRRFAAGLRLYLQEQWPDSIPGAGGRIDGREAIASQGSEPEPCVEGQFSDGTSYLLIRGGAEAAAAPYVMSHPPARRLIVSHRPLILPARATFPMDLFAAEALHGGEESGYRAILGEKEVLSARGSTVFRWVHSEDCLLVEPDSTLYGRASAERLMRLAVGCQFERLHAARIEFGAVSRACAASASASPGSRAAAGPIALPPLVLDRVLDVAGRRTLVRGDLRLPPRHCLAGDLVVTGCLLVGEGARIEGSVKSYKEMVLARGAQVQGSVVSGRSIAVGPECRLAGPVIAEREITIETGARLGSEDGPTTVCAPHIVIYEGVIAFGTIRAGTLGEVWEVEDWEWGGGEVPVDLHSLTPHSPLPTPNP